MKSAAVRMIFFLKLERIDAILETFVVKERFLIFVFKISILFFLI